MRLENRFHVEASPERAWELLNDVPRVIPCMPGAELLETIDDTAWKVSVRVKVGPIALQFLTDIRQLEADAIERRVVLDSQAKEARGRGSAQAQIESRLHQAEEGTDVEIVTDLALQGTVAQYGRGIVADISAQLTQEFADRLSALLASNESGGQGAVGATDRGQGTNANPEPIGGMGLGLKAVWHAMAHLARRLTGTAGRSREA